MKLRLIQFTQPITKSGLIKFFVSFIPFTIITALLLGCSVESDGSSAQDDKLIPSVEAVQVRLGTLPLTERLNGVVYAKNRVEIYPEINAAIVEVHAYNGDFVNRGQPLVRLRDRDLQERLKQSRANYQIALAQAKQAEAKLMEVRAELKRTQALADKELASQAELETIQAQAISAEADLELANARVDFSRATVDERIEALSESIIRAPVSGVVGNRNAEIGMLVNSSTRIFTLGQLDCVKVEIVLTDRMLNYIQAGQRTEIIIENDDTAIISAPLTRISPFLHPVTHSTVAEIIMANTDGKLKPGMFVAVDIHYGESDEASIVPLSALFENLTTGQVGVYVNRDSIEMKPVAELASDQAIALTDPLQFEFIEVEILAKGRMRAGITGVGPGDWVVTLGQNLLEAKSGKARVHPVTWSWVEKLQNLQSQDLLYDIMKMQDSLKIKNHIISQ